MMEATGHNTNTKSKSPKLGPLAGATVTDESQLMMSSQKKINQVSCF